MINEHDIADMMEQSMEAVPEEAKVLGGQLEGEEYVIDFKPFIKAYTKAFIANCELMFKNEWFQEGYEAGVHDAGGKT